MNGDERIEQARLLYEQAVFGGDRSAPEAADRALDAVEADLALARGRLLHARFLDERVEDPRELALFESAARLYQRLGDPRGEAEALFWVGTFHQVIREDNDAALPALQRSYELATRAGDRLTMSYAVRHLGFADLAAGSVEAGRERLEESVRLRREIGFRPGVAAGLVSLAYLHAEQGRDEEATALLAEAGEIAAACGAHGVLRWVAEAQARRQG
ncbi:hypothetical protein [Micromonospora auratinigra]|uniref:Tetratricopeptide repeat-containing protein n=1 Tax=Micromonospora auratinigra TaxID=261654 RepID=A0A1A8ZJU2_9ACTN|nr:hypothetical protein [Micromonospora auratinigra]SBT44161.1 hypothetical protein GA0070611_2594 [Micromonospora auratinigra]